MKACLERGEDGEGGGGGGRQGGKEGGRECDGEGVGVEAEVDDGATDGDDRESGQEGKPFEAERRKRVSST